MNAPRFQIHPQNQQASQSQRLKRKRDPYRRRTLRKAWQRILLPKMEAELAKPASFKPYVTAINAWEVFWRQRAAARRANGGETAEPRASVCMTDAQKTPGKTRISDPPVHRVTKEHLAAFRRWLMADKPRSAITVNNYMRSIGTVLEAASEEDWVRTKKPTLKRLKSRRAAPKVYLSMGQAAAVYRCCERATWPTCDHAGRAVDPVAHWKAAVVLMCCYGFRTQELIRYSSWKRSLRWENFIWQSESPGLTDASSEFGWLRYVPEKQEGHKPDPLLLAVPEIVRLHLRSLSPSRFPESGTIFDWPLSARSMRLQWRSICLAAGVAPKGGSGVPRFLLKHFRKTATTWHNLQTPGIAPWIIGHAQRTSSVSDMHYNNTEIATTRHLATWNYPDAFDRIRDTGQMRLF